MNRPERIKEIVRLAGNLAAFLPADQARRYLEQLPDIALLDAVDEAEASLRRRLPPPAWVPDGFTLSQIVRMTPGQYFEERVRRARGSGLTRADLVDRVRYELGRLGDERLLRDMQEHPLLGAMTSIEASTTGVETLSIEALRRTMDAFAQDFAPLPRWESLPYLDEFAFFEYRALRPCSCPQCRTRRALDLPEWGQEGRADFLAFQRQQHEQRRRATKIRLGSRCLWCGFKDGHTPDCDRGCHAWACRPQNLRSAPRFTAYGLPVSDVEEAGIVGAPLPRATARP